MSIDDFSTPIYDQAPSDDSTLSSTPQSTDLNDLTLSSEPLETNEHLDAYLAPPPVPDGTYTVKVKRIDTKDGRSYTKKNVQSGPNAGREFFFTQHELSIIDPSGKHDGRKLYDRYVTSLPDNAGAIPIVAVLKAMGVDVPRQAGGNAALWAMYDKATKAEPTIKVIVEWEANLPTEISDIYKQPENRAAKRYAPRVRGMNKFPETKPGEHSTEVKVDCSNIGKGMVVATAQARVSRYLPLKG